MGELDQRIDEIVQEWLEECEEPDLPEYDFDGRAYHSNGTRWADMDAPIYSEEGRG